MTAHQGFGWTVAAEIERHTSRHRCKLVLAHFALHFEGYGHCIQQIFRRGMATFKTGNAGRAKGKPEVFDGIKRHITKSKGLVPAAAIVRIDVQITGRRFERNIAQIKLGKSNRKTR